MWARTDGSYKLHKQFFSCEERIIMGLYEEELEKEILELKEYKRMWQSIAGKANLENLIKTNELLLEAVAFYANKDNWQNSTTFTSGASGGPDDSEYFYDGDCSLGGKMARETLIKLYRTE